MVILKICALAVTAVVIISLIKIYKPELAVEAVLASSLILLFYIVGSIQFSFESLNDLYQNISAGKTYFPVIVKCLGIAYLTEFTAALCEDAGEKSIAGKVELAGKLAVFFIALPVFSSLIEMLNHLI